MDTLLSYFGKLRTISDSLSTPQKIFYSGLILVFVASLFFMGYLVNKTEYTPLYSKLSDEDMGSIVETLKAKKIPYQLSGNNSVAIPKESLYEVRLMLATEGIPKGSGVGFEIFDQQKLGSTEFVQKINYQRALQGELARTINRMDEVSESRVHLVLPSDSLFLEDKKPPSAAVVLKLRPRSKLQAQQIQGIVNLVASTVQGMKEDQVTVMSTDGQVLFKKNAQDNSYQLTNLQVQYKGNMEEELRRRVQSLLEPVVGTNKVMARVAVDADFSEVHVSEDRFDPDSAVIRSQQRSVENSQGAEAGPKGNPDAPVNVESQLMQNATPQSGQKTANRQRETVNYEINHVSRKTTQAPGAIKKISVAVVLDGPYEMKANENGKQMPVFAGHSPEQLKSFEEIVKKAVGYDEGRGDQITISNVPFATDSNDPELIKADNYWLKMLKENQKMILNLVLVLLAFVFIVRPFMRRFQELGDKMRSLPDPSSSRALPRPGEKELPGLTEGHHENELTLRKQAIGLVQQNPERAAQVIRALLREEG